MGINLSVEPPAMQDLNYVAKSIDELGALVLCIVKLEQKLNQRTLQVIPSRWKR